MLFELIWLQRTLMLLKSSVSCEIILVIHLLKISALCIWSLSIQPDNRGMVVTIGEGNAQTGGWSISKSLEKVDLL